MRILVLVHECLVPPLEKKVSRTVYQNAEWSTEFDVINTLLKLGHDVRVLGIYDNLSIVRKEIEKFRPHSIFNLLEEFAGEALYEQNIVSYLEILGVACTGCNPKGLMLARDKALAKKVLLYHNIPTPKFLELDFYKKVPLNINLNYPLIVKLATEEASMGIDEKSVVFNTKQLNTKIESLKSNYQSNVIIEEYIEGRELYMGVIGNKNLNSFKCWELFFNDEKMHVATEKVKWDLDYRKTKNIFTGPAKKLKEPLEKKITQLCKKAYRILNISGYARFDMRLTKEGQIYFLEANPNPDIGQFEEFAMSAKVNGVSYEKLIQKIVSLSL